MTNNRNLKEMLAPMEQKLIEETERQFHMKKNRQGTRKELLMAAVVSCFLGVLMMTLSPQGLWQLQAVGGIFMISGLITALVIHLTR